MNKKAFSFIELIVSISILAILSTIWFISYSSYLWDSRDSQRKSDLLQVWSALKVYKQKRWYFPMPWDYFNINYSWTTIAYQWKFDNDVRLSTLDKLPLDPKIVIPYLYSITENKQEYQIASTLENSDNPIALVNWNYTSVSKNILPWIILALERDGTVSETAEVMSWATDTNGENWSDNRKTFILSNQSYNLPYDFFSPYAPSSNATDIDVIIWELEWNNTYWQNTDYRNCIEIEEAGKNILEDWTTVEYQIISSTWSLTNTWCTF